MRRSRAFVILTIGKPVLPDSIVLCAMLRPNVADW
jgi:hypothetical protein